MKATRETKEQFIPVVLTLETQEEVDAIFALLDNSTVTNAIGLSGQCYESLLNYKTNKANIIHGNLNKILKAQ